MRMLFESTGIRAGASTGTNLSAALRLIDRMRRAGRSGSVVTLICDDGNRYLDTYYSDAWLASRGIDLHAGRAALQPFLP
jgi:cysteine synthase A